MKEINQFGHQNHRNKCFYVFIVLAILITSCKNDKFMIDSNEVESLHFWFLPDIDTNFAIKDCETVVFMTDQNKDTVIKDRETIEQYVEIVNSLEPVDPSTCYDLRVSSLIRMKEINGIRKPDVKVCISGINHANYGETYNHVLLNGVLKQCKRKVIDVFLKKKLYDNYSPNDWLPEFIIEYLKDHPEERSEYILDE